MHQSQICENTLEVKEGEGLLEMQWHKIHLTLDQSLAGLETRIRDAFDAIWLVSANDPEMALFSLCNSPARDVDVFVSPKFSSVGTQLLSKYEATLCSPPARSTDDLTLLLGVAYAKNLLP
jgi:hypothetical protein